LLTAYFEEYRRSAHSARFEEISKFRYPAKYQFGWLSL
jgi:hypothetical protein